MCFDVYICIYAYYIYIYIEREREFSGLLNSNPLFLIPIQNCPRLRFLGLMTVGKPGEDPTSETSSFRYVVCVGVKGVLFPGELKTVFCPNQYYEKVFFLYELF
jgi:hypothetical protein